jgi:hypothetical protein
MAVRRIGRAIEEDLTSKCGVGFVAIFTPHFIERMMERKDIFTETAAREFRSLLPLLFDVMRQHSGKTCYKHFGRSFVYLKRKFNDSPSRNRWEVELISVTPDVHGHTEELKFAIPLD